MRQSCPITTIKILTKTDAISADNYKTTGNANQWFWYCGGLEYTAPELVDTKETGDPAKDKRYIVCRNANKLRDSYIVDL